MFWLRQSTANQKVSVLMRNSDGSNLAGLDGTVQIFKNDGTWETANDGSWMNDKGYGWYSVQADATDSATLGKFGIRAHESTALTFDEYGYVIPANVYDSKYSTDKLHVDTREVDGTAVTPGSLLDGTNANLVSIDGELTSGNNATLKLKQLDITNSAGTAMVVKSTGGNGKGLDIRGNGSGEGVLVTSGSGSVAVHYYGVAAGGAGFRCSGGSGAPGFYGVGSGAGAGMQLSAGTGGHGLYAIGGNTGAVSGIYGYSGGGNGHGMKLAGNGIGKDLNATTTDSLAVNVTKNDGTTVSGFSQYKATGFSTYAPATDTFDGTETYEEHATKVHAALVNAVSGDGTNLTFSDIDGTALWTAALPGTTGTRTVS